MIWAFSSEAVDYLTMPALCTGRAVNAWTGILICGSGRGASVAANKFPSIRGAVCHDTFSRPTGSGR